MPGPERYEVRAWIEANWSEDLTVREWWRRLADARLVAPTFPEPYGRGYTLAEGRAVTEELASTGVIGPPIGNVGVRLAAPTLLEYASSDQLATYLPPLLRGEEAWCQLFSEPSAGSDLPGIATRAIHSENGWSVTGQKVWNSAADVSERGMLIARTDAMAPKRHGITFFVIDMEQSGVSARPLRTMNDETDFCEVSLTDARLQSSDIIGEIHEGWKVARTTLAIERSSASDAAGARGLISVPSGKLSGQLDRIVGDVLAAGSNTTSRFRTGALRMRDMITLARDRERILDPVIRQHLARYYTVTEVHRMTLQRARTSGQIGRPGPEGSIAKLALGQICNMSRDLSFTLLGADAMLIDEGPLGAGEFQRIGLSSPGVTIGAGTDEIQRNTIGEQVLGLPKEPSEDVDLES